MCNQYTQKLPSNSSEIEWLLVSLIMPRPSGVGGDLIISCPFREASYTTDVSLLPMDKTADGKGDTEHLGGAGGKYVGLGGLGTFPDVCWALRACLILPQGVSFNGIFSYSDTGV